MSPTEQVGIQKMNKILFCLAVGTFTLSACNSQKPEDGLDKDAEYRKQSLTALAQTRPTVLPNGHWIVNDGHCQKRLSSSGVFDLKITDNTVKAYEIEQKGEWSLLPADAQVVFSNHLSNAKPECFKTGALQYLKFSAPGTQIEVAFAPGEQLALMRIYPDPTVKLAAIFNKEELASFEFVAQETLEEQQAPAETADSPEK
jgi:hypothetical protein